MPREPLLVSGDVEEAEELEGRDDGAAPGSALPGEGFASTGGVSLLMLRLLPCGGLASAASARGADGLWVDPSFPGELPGSLPVLDVTVVALPSHAQSGRTAGQGWGRCW